MNPTTIMTTFLGATALVSTATVSAQELGHVASVTGRVIVQKANGSQVPAKARMPLYHGDRIVVLRKSVATVAYADTGCVDRYDQNTNIKIVKGNGCVGSAVTVTKGPARTITKKLVTTNTLPTYIAPSTAPAGGSFAGVGTGWGLLAAGLGIAGVAALLDDDENCVSGC